MSDTKNTKKLLIFNMDENKATLIRTLCVNLNVRLVKVYSPQYGESIGALAAKALGVRDHRHGDVAREKCGAGDGNAAQYELERGTALQRAFRRT